MKEELLKQYQLKIREILDFKCCDNVMGVFLCDVDSDNEDEIVLKYMYESDEFIEILKHRNSSLVNLCTMKNNEWFDIQLYPAAQKKIGGTFWGYINQFGENMINYIYSKAYDYSENELAIVSCDNLYGIINKRSDYVAKPEYLFINDFYCNLAIAVNDNGSVVINQCGKKITSRSYIYISDYKENRAVFEKKIKKNMRLYGYLDENGEEIVKARFRYAGEFDNSKALVKLDENKFALINPTGELLNQYDKGYVGNYSQGMLSFLSDAKYGYMNENGEEIIKPTFSIANEFKDNRAIVAISNEYSNLYGLIDSNGAYIINPEFKDIVRLSKDRFAVGIEIDNTKPYIGFKYALYDNCGNALSEFKYYHIYEYKDEIACANDSTNTFFIDKSGDIVNELPVINGVGFLQKYCDLIKCDIDKRISYVTNKNEIIYAQNKVIKLGAEYYIHENKYSLNKNYIVYYASITGLKNTENQIVLNKKIKHKAGVKRIDDNQIYTYTYFSDFEVEFYKCDFLVLKIMSYKYYFGAAHGMPGETYLNIDLNTGCIYKLKDLFKEDSDYKIVINKSIRDQIVGNPEYEYVWPEAFKGISSNQQFSINDTYLNIYFSPYEISPYAGGFLKFEISLCDLKAILCFDI